MPTPAEVTEVRLKLRRAGFDPIPAHGKRPSLGEWQKMIGVAEHEVQRWERAYPSAENTGILTARTPTFDIDLYDPNAAQAVEELVRNHFEEKGAILGRTGLWPKRAIPFRCDAPFAKISVTFEGEKGEKLEFLGNGQQFVAHGIHPDTHEPYQWDGGELGEVARGDLPYIHEEEARELVEWATQMLAERFGYRIAGESRTKEGVESGNGAGGGNGWGEYLIGVASGDHDAMVRFAMALVNSGMNRAAAENFLHDTVTAYAANIDPERLKRRLHEIPDMVSSARRIFDAEEKEERGQPQAGAQQALPQAPAAGPLAELGERNAAHIKTPPPRAWLLGNVFCRTFISSLIAEGGTGKTALRYAQLLSLAIGRSLTGERVWRRCVVLIISLEDSEEELDRRICAVMRHYGVDPSEVDGWLWIRAPGAKAGKLMTVNRKGRAEGGTMAAIIERAIVRRKVDIVSLDPFVKTHGVSENDNNLIDQVTQVLLDLSAKYDIAVDTPHHVRKGPSDPGNADRARGASSQKDAYRLVYTLSTMCPEEAETFGIPEEERHSYVRMDKGKVNIVPPARKAQWFKIVGVRLENATELYPNGDEVQTVEPWTPPETFDGLDTETINRILDTIDAGLPDGERYSSAPRATTRAAWQAVERHTPGKPESQCREIIRQWLANGLLIVEIYQSKKDRKSVEGLRVDNAKRPGARTDT
jgi:AAA domain/Bifunctional DNA primase/polymerase, N-terminal